MGGGRSLPIPQLAHLSSEEAISSPYNSEPPRRGADYLMGRSGSYVCDPEAVEPSQSPGPPHTPNPCPTVGGPGRERHEGQGEEWSGPDLCNFTTSEIGLVDATDSGLEDEEEEDEEEEETEFPSETRFLLRLGMLLSLAGRGKGF